LREPASMPFARRPVANTRIEMKKFWLAPMGALSPGLLACGAAVLTVAGLLSGCRVYDYDQVELSQQYQTVADVKRDWSYTDRLYVAAKDVCWDLLDVVSLDTSWGDGMIANVHFTRFANAGLGWFDGLRVGWDQRASGTWAERGYEYGVGPFYWKDKTKEPVYGNRILFERGYSYTGFELDKNNVDGEALDFGARLHLAYVGASVDVSPKEVVDLFASVGGFAYTLVLWPFSAVYDLDPPEIDLSDDNELSRIRKDLGTLSGQIYQPTTPFLERTGKALPPKRSEGHAVESEMSADALR
jgi:hypothetical protein